METKRVYPSTQLIVALDAKVLKVYLWILSWSAKGDVKFYPKQFAKACKMEEEEVERCIQTLINTKLIDATLVEQTWMLTPNAEQNQKYYDIPISKVLEGNGIPMADKATWNREEVKTEKKEASWEDLSESQLEKLIQRLQIIKNEKEQTKKVVVTNNVVDDLPF
jgi:hypothetical protein